MAPDSLSEADASWAGRILHAVVDGLQIQWLLDPSIDMEADTRRLIEVLVERLAPPSSLTRD